MANLNIKLNLANLEKVGVTTLNGANGAVKCVVIPVDDNKIFVSEKGLYLDLVAIETKESKYGDTHFIKRQLTAEERTQEKLSGERKGKILGNVKPIAYQQAAAPDNNTVYSQIPQNNTAQPTQPAAQPQQPSVPTMPMSDESLPF